MSTTQWEEVPDEELRVGDVVRIWAGTLRITARRKYTGPLDCVVALVDTVGAPPTEDSKCRGFSIVKGSYTERKVISE